jgi:hypothetical protein
LEGDAFKIVNTLGKKESCWTRYGQLIEDSRVILNSLQSWVVGHVGRKANKAAYRLEKLALCYSLDLIFIRWTHLKKKKKKKRQEEYIFLK